VGYLYLNFLENQNKGSQNWDDFYTLSLNEQYNSIKTKLGSIAPNDLRSFISACFPPMIQHDYYISMPCFSREMKQDRRGRDCIFNIVIRPGRSIYMDSCVPPRYDIIVIGDLIYDKVTSVAIKGIELIDSNVAKFGEKRVSCMAMCGFENTSFTTRDGRTHTVLDYGTKDINQEVLTRDFIDELCHDVFPIPNPEKAVKAFLEWEKYIRFRKYYLSEQSKKCEAFDSVTVKDGFMVSKQIYNKNKESWQDFLLDGHEEFSRGEQIVLSRQVTGADDFPLICVSISQNRKELLSDTIGKGTNAKPRREIALRRYTRDSMGLSSMAPQYDQNGNLPKGFRFNQYLLGERFTFAYTDIEPDCSVLERKVAKDVTASAEDVDARYYALISKEVADYVEAQKPGIAARYQSELEVHRASLEDKLDAEVAENKDKKIRSLIDDEVERQAKEIKSGEKKRKDELQAQIKAIQSEKKKDKAEVKEKIKELQSEISRIGEETKKAIESIRSKIDVRPYYEARLRQLVETKAKSLKISEQEELRRLETEKRDELNTQYKGAVSAEKEQAKKEIQSRLQTEVAEKITEETVRRYDIYFRPSNSNDSVKDLRADIEKEVYKFLTFDNRAEKAKIERQEKALASLRGGYVKNPYLASYLFAPELLAQQPKTAREDPVWCLESLNDKQKTAVKQALSSDSIFLLQGPPGTGKTQVIAEITAQYAKQGKKVLISSETHKAIDNVFDRLPKIPEIRPLRLIPSQNGKETSYSPERLVDNFYLNIQESLQRQIDRFEHFEEAKENFSAEMKRLRSSYDRLLELQRENARIKQQRERLIGEINSMNAELEKLREQEAFFSEESDLFDRTDRFIDSLHFDSEGAKENILLQYKKSVQMLLGEFSCFKGQDLSVCSELLRADITEIRTEVSAICGDSRLAELQAEQKKLQADIESLRDEDTLDYPVEGDANYPQYVELRGVFIELAKQIKQFKNGGAVDAGDGVIAKIVLPEIRANKELLSDLVSQVSAFRIKFAELQGTYHAVVKDERENTDSNLALAREKIADKKREINSAKARYDELGESEGITEEEELSSELKRKISKFFRDFSIVREYDPSNLQKAFDIISEEWVKLESNHKRNKREDNVKIPMFRDICKYLQNEDILEEDRQAYTRLLYDNVNVFGITCTSRDRFTPQQLKELGQYGIESVDIRTQGIDVVIIDEVSKSSFLDLLIPILYGKTVILVGDHRQLPPMYDLRHMRESDFAGLDESIITKDINDHYTELYETCFFKTLYEAVPSEFRVMLNKQYRCHSHIMRVFNHFYGGDANGLQIGKAQQDDEKQHNLTVFANGNVIVDPKHHIYFVDCPDKESSEEGSTSKINKQEAEVVMALLQDIDEASVARMSKSKVVVDRDKRIDERPSIGVICTYGDQASLIKKRRKNQQYKGFSGREDERLIISTVDDFQGDERDIIIVSMVRNPRDMMHFNAEFVKQFERINVAFSRARKLLVIVGAAKFLSEQTIELPDLSGDHLKDKTAFPVYREIIDTIKAYGRVWTAEDIIGG